MPTAVCTCCECGATETLRADFGAGRKRPTQISETPNQGQCVKKLQAKGWSFFSKRLRCPACTEARRRSNTQRTKEDAVSKTLKTNDLSQLDELVSQARDRQPSPSEAPLPEPTPKQARLIMMALEEHYDDAKQRYRGESTDKTVAEELGDGIRPGWVAKMREQFFGPAGGNEEMDRLHAEIARWMAEGNAMAAAALKLAEDHAAAMKSFEVARERVKELAIRLDVICRNVGPKAGR